MSLPLELVREIIHFLLFSAPPRFSTAENPGGTTKPTWGTIDALSLTSKSYRALVLEAWFRTLYIGSPESLIFLQDSGWFPEMGSKWTTHLHCVQPYSITLYVWNLSSFLRVSSIRLDWLRPPVSPEPDTLPFLHLSSTVEHLDLRRWMWPDRGAIEGIAITPGFQRLKTLQMVKDRVWCGLCHTCCVVRFEDSPMRLVYEGGFGLPVSSVLSGVEKKLRLMMMYVDPLRACFSTT